MMDAYERFFRREQRRTLWRLRFRILWAGVRHRYWPFIRVALGLPAGRAGDEAR